MPARMSARYCQAVAEKEMDWREYLGKKLESTCVQSIMGLIIIGNALVIGGETDLPHLLIWSYLEKVFLVIFIGELVLKIFAKGLSRFFCEWDQDIIWNLFDFAIVLLGVVDFISELVLRGSDQGFATIFRLVRLLRILRVFRIFRMLKQLYLLAAGFAEAAQAVVWVTVLMAFVLYTCSIILVRCLGHGTEDDSFWADKYGDIPTAMLTLFKLMSQPDLEPYHSRLAHHPALTMFLIIFIIFGSFGMIALLTGVISESMFDKNQTRMEEERIEREGKRELLALEVEKLYGQYAGIQNSDRSAEIEVHNLEDLLADVTHLFQSAGVPYTSHDLKDLMAMLDMDGSGAVSKWEFSHAILSISEGIRPLCFVELYHAVRQVHAIVEKLQERFTNLEALAENTSRQTDLQKDFACFRVEIFNVLKDIQSKAGVQNKQMSTLSSSVDAIGKQIEASQLQMSSMSASLQSIDAQVQELKIATDLHANMLSSMDAHQSEAVTGDATGTKVSKETSLYHHGDDTQRDAASDDRVVDDIKGALRNKEPVAVPKGSEGDTLTSSGRAAVDVTSLMAASGLTDREASNDNADAKVTEALTVMLRQFAEQQQTLATEVASRVLAQLEGANVLVLQASSGGTPESVRMQESTSECVS